MAIVHILGILLKETANIIWYGAIDDGVITTSQGHTSRRGKHGQFSLNLQNG